MRALSTALGVAALGCVLLGAASDRASTGAVFVTTLPPGSDVWVDGTYVGRTPVFVDSLNGGKHALTLTRSGWAEREVDVDVTAGLTTMSSFRMTQSPHAGAHASTGSVVFHGLGSGAHVTLDGGHDPRDPSGPIALSPGTHVAVVVTHDGKTTRTFTVYPDTTTHVVVARAAADAAKAAVVAPAEEFLPTDAYRVDGKKVTVVYARHVVVAKIGDPNVRYDGVTVAYDAAPSMIGGRLYLPLALLVKLTR